MAAGLVVVVSRAGDEISGQIFLDGQEVGYGEIQWGAKTPWRSAPSGRAVMPVVDPDKCLTMQGRVRRKRIRVMPRIYEDGEPVIGRMTYLDL